MTNQISNQMSNQLTNHMTNQMVTEMIHQWWPAKWPTKWPTKLPTYIVPASDPPVFWTGKVAKWTGKNLVDGYNLTHSVRSLPAFVTPKNRVSTPKKSLLTPINGIMLTLWRKLFNIASRTIAQLKILFSINCTVAITSRTLPIIV